MVMVADRGGAIRESIALGRAYAEARRDGGSELIEELVATPPQVNPTDMGRPTSSASSSHSVSTRLCASWRRGRAAYSASAARK
jgi:hypothetical protein